VRGGRPPSPELVEEMRHNYAAIGGRSPLTEITLAQADALRARLGPDVPVAVGMRNWSPFIKDALGELAAVGVTRVIGIPLAPQFSTLSVQKYTDAARAALAAAREPGSTRRPRRAPVARPRRSRGPTCFIAETSLRGATLSMRPGAYVSVSGARRPISAAKTSLLVGLRAWTILASGGTTRCQPRSLCRDRADDNQ